MLQLESGTQSWWGTQAALPWSQVQNATGDEPGLRQTTGQAPLSPDNCKMFSLPCTMFRDET